MRVRLLSFFLSTTVVLSAAAARADEISYVFTENSNVITFTIPQAPTPSASMFDEFQLFNVAILNNGQSSQGYLQFALSPSGACNFAVNGGICGLTSMPLFSGTAAAPVLLAGTFQLTDNFDGNAPGTLVATDIPDLAATPEPSSLVLLGTGAVGVLGMARRRFRRA